MRYTYQFIAIFMSDVKWQVFSPKFMKIFKPIKSIWILGEVKKWKKRSVEAWVELTKWIFFWEKWKSEKTRSVEVLGVLLFVGRNCKKIFLGKLGKVKKWKKNNLYLRLNNIFHRRLCQARMFPTSPSR